MNSYNNAFCSKTREDSVIDVEGLASTKTSRPVAKPSTLSSYSSRCAHACRMSSPALVGLAVSPLWNVVCMEGRHCLYELPGLQSSKL